MNQGKKKTDNILADRLEKLEPNETIDVLVYVKPTTINFNEYLQSKKESNEVNFNFLPFANCYVVEASKSNLIEISNHEDVVKVVINPRFGTA